MNKELNIRGKDDKESLTLDDESFEENNSPSASLERNLTFDDFRLRLR